MKREEWNLSAGGNMRQRFWYWWYTVLSGWANFCFERAYEPSTIEQGEFDNFFRHSPVTPAPEDNEQEGTPI